MQIVHILNDAIGKPNGFNSYSSFQRDRDEPEEIFEFINETLSREYGKFSLLADARTHREAVLNSFLNEKDTEMTIDVIQLSFQCINRVIKDDFQNYSYRNTVKAKPDEAIEELNGRFKEHAVGFAFEGGEIIRIDSTYTHSEVVM